MLLRFARRYAHGNDRPLGGYAVLLGTYSAATVAGVMAVRASGKRVPDRPSVGDLALLTAATHIGTRLIARDSVTAVLRSPFTRYEGPAGEGEVNESVVATGVGHAVGELLTCPFCLAVWVATALGFGMLLAPRASRWVAGVLTAVAGSDYLQYAFTALREQA
jgi:hypothetical protein